MVIRRDAIGEDPDKEEDESEEDGDEGSEDEEEESEEEEAAPQPELTRAQRKELKKKQGGKEKEKAEAASARAKERAKAKEDGDAEEESEEEDDDEFLVNSNHVQKKMTISDLSKPVELTRRERWVLLLSLIFVCTCLRCFFSGLYLITSRASDTTHTSSVVQRQPSSSDYFLLHWTTSCFCLLISSLRRLSSMMTNTNPTSRSEQKEKQEAKDRYWKVTPSSIN